MDLNSDDSKGCCSFPANSLLVGTSRQCHPPTNLELACWLNFSSTGPFLVTKGGVKKSSFNWQMQGLVVHVLFLHLGIC